MTIHIYDGRCGYRCGNAGDELSKPLVEHLSGQPVSWAGMPDATLVACGSVAEKIPQEYSGLVWGTGLMFEDRRVNVRNCTVAAVRGKLTAARWAQPKLRSVPLGDPGLLVDLVFPAQRTLRYRVGVVPHYVDANNMELNEWCRRNLDVTVIDICARLEDVVREIAECDVVLSSSLHGLIFADALGVPNEWVVLSEKVQGGSFKFRDYLSVFGFGDAVPMEFTKYTSVSEVQERAAGYSRPGIEQVKRDLARAFREAYPSTGT